MTTSDIVIILILLGCMATYIPVFMCLFFTAVLGFLLFTDFPLLLLAQTLFRSMDNFALVVVLFFILCGNIMTAGSIVEKLIKFANTLVSWLPGGLGMAGILDTARYRAFLAEALNVSPRDISALLMGGHGDTMVPLPRYTTVAGIPVTELIDEEKLNAIVDRTKKGGGELVNLMGTSAWYAPGSAAAQMVEAIVMDQKRIFPCCVKLEGEYGLNDMFVGVPVKLGKNGVEEIIEVKLNDDERQLLNDSAKAVKGVMEVLDGMNIL